MTRHNRKGFLLSDLALKNLQSEAGKYEISENELINQILEKMVWWHYHIYVRSTTNCFIYITESTSPVKSRVCAFFHGRNNAKLWHGTYKFLAENIGNHGKDDWGGDMMLAKSTVYSGKKYWKGADPGKTAGRSFDLIRKRKIWRRLILANFTWIQGEYLD